MKSSTEMELNIFLDSLSDIQLREKVLQTVTSQLDGKSVLAILDIMKEHEVDRIFLETGWELKINGDYKNPHSSNPKFRAGKIKSL